MTAVRWHDRADVRVDQIDAPDPPGPDGIRVAVACCGLCGTDVHECRNGPLLVPTQPHPVTGQMAPVVLGHEISGWVESVGDAVSGLSVGDLVVLNALLPCGHCPACAEGAAQRCATLGHLGFSADGGLAELVTVTADMAVRVPDHVPAHVAALAEPFSVAMHAIDAAGRPEGASCLVSGAGTIGLAVALILADLGNDVRVVDRDPRRQEIADDFGFRGSAGPAAVAFECSGGVSAVAAVLAACRPGGLVVLCGLPERVCEVDVTDLVLRELRVRGSVGHMVEPDLVSAVEFISAHTALVEPLVTARIPLENAVAGLELLTGPDRGKHGKVVVEVATDLPHA
ncbi:MAG: alcohol dehydrogenase catalytic domain-containing protein [Actinobacteria bacterium]|nr:alcohol dehydrogenase catalytic domain-containing protein [Actinomycetota bacterium]